MLKYTILVYSIRVNQPELFDESEQAQTTGIVDFFLLGKNNSPGAPPGLAGLCELSLYELSIDAFYAALYARMSELPIGGEISRYVEKVGKAQDRNAAARIAFDRGDPGTLAVLKAAYKVQHEIHRLTGLLRFRADSEGTYIAHCAPDHFILPALAEHFTLRFGETRWAIIDEKRGLCLCRKDSGPVQLGPAQASASAQPVPQDASTEICVEDCWEDLWRLYHRSVNNEAKKNLKLQRQFMPERYRKYLTEL